MWFFILFFVSHVLLLNIKQQWIIVNKGNIINNLFGWRLCGFLGSSLCFFEF